jgi:hypothetical protein
VHEQFLVFEVPLAQAFANGPTLVDNLMQAMPVTYDANPELGFVSKTRPLRSTAGDFGQIAGINWPS